MLGVVEEPQAPILAPKLAKIGASVGLREARSINLSSSIVDGVPVDGLMPRGRP